MLGRLCFGALLAVGLLPGHDMVHEAAAGPYRLNVYLNPHARQSNFVEILARSESAGVLELRFALTGVDATDFKSPYSSVTVRPVAGDPNLFRASLPLPPLAFWRLHVEARGLDGEGRMSIPVAAAAPAVGLTPDAANIVSVLLWATLAAALVLLWRLFRGRGKPATRLAVAAALTSPLLLMALSRDWVASAVYYPPIYQRLYQPLELRFDTNREGVLSLELHDPGLLKFRRLDDLVLDHGHPMHLYALALPGLDRVYHLHPEQVGPGLFEKKLPSMPAGRYFVVTDIVHESGLWEAPRGEWNLDSAIDDSPFQGDDSGGAGHPISDARYGDDAFDLPDGYRMVWLRPERPLRSNDPLRLQFKLETSAGEPAADVELYMGMMGHAAIVRHDLEVFSHVHPSGSIAMASLDAFDRGSGMGQHEGHHMAAFPAAVTFPYVFPEPGRYRLIVQTQARRPGRDGLLRRGSRRRAVSASSLSG